MNRLNITYDPASDPKRNVSKKLRQGERLVTLKDGRVALVRWNHRYGTYEQLAIYPASGKR